jgi:hypothetical protein
MVLRRIFGPKRKEVTVDWTKLEKKEFNALDSLPNTIHKLRTQDIQAECLDFLLYDFFTCGWL